MSEISDCLYSLNKIVSSLKIFFNEQEGNWEEVAFLQKNSIDILSGISDFLDQNKIKTETLTLKEKTWGKDYRKTLGYTSKEFEDNYEYEDEEDDDNNNSLIEEQQEEERATKTYNKFKNILVDYCKNSIGKVSYKYCNPIHNKNKSLENCQPKSLQILKETNSRLGIKLFRLNNEFRNIAYNYLEKAPKKFNDIISRIIKYQNLKYIDIAELMNDKSKDKKKYASSIKGLGKNNSNKLSSDDMEKLKKILLVTDDIIKCGSGEVYGNWNDFLKNQTDPIEKNTLLDYYEETTHQATKPKILNDIRELINNETKFEKAKNSSELFCKKYVCLYTIENEYSHEICYDYDSMYQNLIYPQDFDTLLSVLEELQANEQ